MDMGKWSTLATLDMVGSLGFDYEFRARESASISGSSNTEEKSDLELADSCNTILDIGVHRTEWKIQHRMATKVDSTQPALFLLAKLTVKTGIYMKNITKSSLSFR